MRMTAQPVLFRVALFRLLAINLGIGVSISVLLVAGLLWLDIGGLRHLILADRSPAVALGLMLFGFVVTLGSAAMGTAIMAIGRRPGGDRWPPSGTGEPATAAVRPKSP